MSCTGVGGHIDEVRVASVANAFSTHRVVFSFFRWCPVAGLIA